MRIAVVGGGATAALFTAQAARMAAARGTRAEVVVIDPTVGTPAMWRGVAYAAQLPIHTLNVHAGRVSAWSDDPLDFVRYVNSEKLGVDEAEATTDGDAAAWLPPTGDEMAGRHDGSRPVTASDFLPRAWMGDYLQATVEATVEAATPRLGLTQIRGSVIDVEAPEAAFESSQRGTARVIVATAGETVGVTAVEADHVILATGNQAATLECVPPIDGSVRDIRRSAVVDPWSEAGRRRLAAIDPTESVLLVGTRHTMLDVALELLDSRLDMAPASDGATGDRRASPVGKITAFSRTGLLPATHLPDIADPHSPPAVTMDDFLDSDGAVVPLDDLVARVCARVEAAKAAEQAGDATAVPWQRIMDGVHLVSNDLWLRMSAADRDRFLSSPLFGEHQLLRHRSAPVARRIVDTAIERGLMEIVSGDAVAASRLGQSEVRFVFETSDEKLADEAAAVAGGFEATVPRAFVDADWLINCTGPDMDYGSDRVGHIVKTLRSKGLLRPHASRLGIDADPETYAVLDAAGEPQPWLSTIGPTLKGSLLEVLAISEIRGFAERLAGRLVA